MLHVSTDPVDEECPLFPVKHIDGFRQWLPTIHHFVLHVAVEAVAVAQEVGSYERKVKLPERRHKIITKHLNSNLGHLSLQMFELKMRR